MPQLPALHPQWYMYIHLPPSHDQVNVLQALWAQQVPFSDAPLSNPNWDPGITVIPYLDLYPPHAGSMWPVHSASSVHLNSTSFATRLP